MQTKIQRRKVDYNNLEAFKLLTENEYTGDFNVWFLKKLTEGSVKFIYSLEGRNLVRKDEQGREIQKISLKLVGNGDLSPISKAIQEKTRDVYIEKRKQHRKNELNGQKVYHDDWVYNFYHKNAHDEILLRPSRGPWDWNRLITTNLTLFMVITIEDTLGYQKAD